MFVFEVVIWICCCDRLGCFHFAVILWCNGLLLDATSPPPAAAALEADAKDLLLLLLLLLLLFSATELQLAILLLTCMVLVTRTGGMAVPPPAAAAAAAAGLASIPIAPTAALWLLLMLLALTDPLNPGSLAD